MADSSILSQLKSFGEQVKNEELQNLGEIAVEVKSNVDKVGVNDPTTLDAEADADALINDMGKRVSITSPRETIKDYDKDVNALLREGGITPPKRRNSSSKLYDDEDFNSKDKEKASRIERDAKSLSPGDNHKSRRDKIIRERYRNHRSSTASTQSTHNNKHSKSLPTARLSSLSFRLNETERKPQDNQRMYSSHSEFQDTLLRTMAEITCSDEYHQGRSRQKKKTQNEDKDGILERLCCPRKREPSLLERKRDPALRYLTFDDAKECTFKPELASGNKGSRKNNTSDEIKVVEDSRFAFISRQEADERNRRESLTHNIGQTEYNARLDKKQCPSCGNKQTYDEVREKRKFCPNCGKEYRCGILWSQVSNKFFERNKKYAHLRKENFEKLVKQIEEDERAMVKKIVDEKSGKIVVEYKATEAMKVSPEANETFLRGVEEKVKKREAKLKEIESDAYKSYTFAPAIPKPEKKRGEFDDFSDDEDEVIEDPVRAFLRRYDEDMEYRREKMPYKYKQLDSPREKDAKEAKDFRF